MMTINRTATSKKAYLGQNSNSESGLKGLIKHTTVTKTFDFPNGSKVEAKRVVVPAEEVETKTSKHPKNLRSIQGLTIDAVRDIYESIEKGGVNLEGIAIECEETGNYLLLDSSRRRFCCVLAGKDLPLWLLPPLNTYQIDSLISDAQKSKKWSWREEGLEYIRIREEKGLSTLDDLSTYLGRGKETVRKRVQAAEINEKLINCFPDSEGIPTKFYPALAKIEKQLLKLNKTIDLVISKLPEQDREVEVEVRQREVLDFLKETVSSSVTDTLKWVKVSLGEQGKGSSATIATSSDGRSTKFEFTRVSNKKIEQITEFIKQTLSQ